MEEDRPFSWPSFALPPSNPDPNSIRAEIWVAAEEPAREVLNCVNPTLDSEEKRKDVTEYMQKLIKTYLGIEAFPYGSVPLKTYLPDGDIDLTALSIANGDERLPHDLLAVLQAEEQRGNPKFGLRQVHFIDAEVKLVKCMVQDIVIDISFNQLGGLCTLCFLEQVDRLVGKDHLFKRSIILIKTWCYYESRILGAHYGLLSTYALETLVLYIFHFFSASLTGPLEVLYRFLDYYSKFDWDNYCISLDGPVRKSFMPNKVVENPLNDGTGVLLSGEFLRNCMNMFTVPTKGPETYVRPFSLRNINIIDPLKENNNLGRSVNQGNFYRIQSAFRLGARKLGRILELESDKIRDEIKIFFANAFKMQKSKYGSDSVLSFGFGTLSTSSSFTNYEDDVAKLSNSDIDDYMSAMDDDVSLFRGLTLKTDYEKPDAHSERVNKGSGFVDLKGDGDRDNGSDSDPLADLTGDYDSHIRSLLYGQCCHGYALSAAEYCTSPPASPYGTSELWVQPWSVPYHPGPSESYVNPNAGPYNPHFTARAGERSLHGTGPYYPIAKGRSRGPVPANCKPERARVVQDETNREGSEQGPREPSQTQPPARPVNPQRKLEFGSFGPLPEGISNVEASQPKKQQRDGNKFIELNNEEDFPPL